MDGKLELELGIFFNFTLTAFMWLIFNAFPILSFVSTLCWAIIGCHGLWTLFRGRKND